MRKMFIAALFIAHSIPTLGAEQVTCSFIRGRRLIPLTQVRLYMVLPADRHQAAM